MSSDGKTLANAAYNAAVVSGLAIGYAQLGKKVLLDFTAYDAGMVVLDVGLALATNSQTVYHPGQYIKVNTGKV